MPSPSPLDSLRDAIDTGDAGVRLVVPTATLAEHLRHLLAREGRVVRPRTVVTLARFAAECGAADPASNAALTLLTERALQANCPREFAAVAGTAGFVAAVARTIEELDAAGVDSRRLPGVEPYGRALAAVRRQVEDEFARREWKLRPGRLREAAALVRERGVEGVHTIWFEGFFAFSPAELAFIEALRQWASVTVVPFEPRPQAARAVFHAATPDREAEEIARRLLAMNRPWRDCAVVVRTPDVYEGPLITALSRFGIPARSYFGRRLDEDRRVRRALALTGAMLSGWEFEQTLAALRLGTDDTDALDLAIRARQPGSGLAELRELKFDTAELDALEPWRGESLTAAEWAARFAPMADWAEACEETARIEGVETALPCAGFARTLAAVARLSRVHERDRRRDVVHVMSAYEARQWELPVVFVCGLVERQFPLQAGRDPLLPEAARRALGLRTAEDRETEERFLFDVAVSRATEQVVLSWPLSGTRGGVAVRSSFLDRDGEAAESWVCPEPSQRQETATEAIDLTAALTERTQTVSPSGLERFAECPFRFFAGDTLKLKTRPARPDERLDFALRGMIVHEVLAGCKSARDVGAVFEQSFRRTCERYRIQPGYHREFWRQRMLDDLRRFFDDPPIAMADGARTEAKFEMPLAGFTVRGRIDRLEPLEDGRTLVVDFKYSKDARKRVTNPAAMQGPIYTIAAERMFGVNAGAMAYIALRDEVRAAGWSAGAAVGFQTEPLTREWLDESERKAVAAVESARAGVAAPRPISLDICRYCDYKDICRYEAAGAAEAAGE